MDERTELGTETVAMERVARRADVADLLTAIFDAEQARLYAYALAAAHDPEAAADAVAETFSRLVREAYAGRMPENSTAWLFRVCGNLIISGRRRRSVARRWLGHLVDRGVARSPEDAAVAREADAELVNALSTLHRDARIALLLAAEGLSMQEIAETLGRTPAATRTFICRSRLKLREGLERGGQGAER